MNKPFKLRRILAPLGIIGLSIILFIFLFKTKPTTEQKVIEEKIWFIESQIIRKGNFHPSIDLIAQTISTENIEISSAIAADVSRRWVNEGDKVKQGQKLLSLDKSTFTLLVAQRIAEKKEINALIREEINRNKTDKSLLENENDLLNIANNAVSRAKTLKKNAMASSAEIDDAKRAFVNQQISIIQRQASIKNHPVRLTQLRARLKSAESRLALAKKDLSHTDIIAPVNATITKITLDQGEHVRKGTVLLNLYNHDQLELKTMVPEKYLPVIRASLQNDQPLYGQVILENRQEVVTLQRMSGEITPNAASSYLYFSIDTRPIDFLIGQTFVIKLILPEIENSIALPSDALYGVDTVFLINDQRLERVQVEWLGETTGDIIEMTPDIAANEINPEEDLSLKVNNSQFSQNPKSLFLIKSSALQNGDSVLTSKFANAMDGLKVTTSTLK